MKTRHILGTSPDRTSDSRARSSGAPAGSGSLVHLSFMDTTDTATHSSIEPVLTLSELADRLHVNAQTLYDLRSHGRGPRGFRVGRELRFRATEIDAWLASLEAADAERHPAARPVHRDTA